MFGKQEVKEKSKAELALVKDFPGLKTNPQGPSIFVLPYGPTGKYGDLAMSRGFGGFKLHINKGKLKGMEVVPMQDRDQALSWFHKLGLALKEKKDEQEIVKEFKLIQPQVKENIMAKKQKSKKTGTKKLKKIIDKKKINSIKASIKEAKASMKTIKAESKAKLKKDLAAVKTKIKDLKLDLKATKKGK